jgi:pimeloyl-ACP methyl ester carboxylesterase
MPYAMNAGTRIHYEVDGVGPALVLQHGFTQCLEDWIEHGYVPALRERYRVILIDARGHGSSDKPHDPASYAMDLRASDVTAVLDNLGVEKAHYWGYSMGGAIGFAMAKYASHRVDALVIGSSIPHARDQSGLRQLARAGITGGGDAFIAAFDQMIGPMPRSDSRAMRLRTADFEAYLAAQQDRGSMEDVLPTMAMPCCLYSGEAESNFSLVRSASEQIPNARFFSLPGLSHGLAFTESSQVLPPVMAFLDSAR